MPIFTLVPAFNEASKIGTLLEEVPTTVDGIEVEVVVIDDGSTDQTRAVAMASGVGVLRNETNQGKGAALCRGLKALSGRTIDAIVWMDADGQHRPSSIPDIVRPVLRDRIDLCVGSRYLSAHQSGSAPLNRRIVRNLVMRTVRRRTGFDVTDPFSGFRCFSPAAYRALSLVGCGYESELESCFSVARAGLTYGEVPIERIYGPGMSKMGYVDGALLGRLRVVIGYARAIGRELTPDLGPLRVALHE